MSCFLSDKFLISFVTNFSCPVMFIPTENEPGDVRFHEKYHLKHARCTVCSECHPKLGGFE